MRRTALRRQLQAVAAGKSKRISIDLEDSAAAAIVEEVAGRLGPDSFALDLLVVAFKDSKAADAVVERMSSRSVRDRVTGARIAGALHIYETVPWLSPLLAAHDPSVADAAARALGKIGGNPSASSLLFAIRRRGPTRRLISELARCAPDLFVESALAERQKPTVRPALAIAAGLRRRHTAVSHLATLLQRGSRRERVISCRALGWIGAGTAIPLIRVGLGDRDWKIRLSAAKALGTLRASSCRRELEYLYADRNPRVRKAAKQALYLIDRVPARRP
ncbi:MAG TPA: HEAT repeat domain-containing protein, partial [Candidatus Dormibacteraeota bacterium]|nr:HEAT repeat domain-containing protein [Candidatus Dormibacteraeota bacterium]